jgi:hypothetical protein
VVLTPKLHRDKTAWGEDAEAFRPERFENPANILPHAYKPFGTGQRACIGQQFAMQEATLDRSHRLSVEGTRNSGCGWNRLGHRRRSRGTLACREGAVGRRVHTLFLHCTESLTRRMRRQRF